MWKLFGIDPELAKQATDWSLQWRAAWPPWLIVLVIGVGIAYVYHLYRREASPLTLLDRVLLTAMRVLAVAVLLVMAFEPEIVWDIPAEKDVSLLVLLDNSQSMGISDRYEGSTRVREVAKLLWPDETKGWSGLSVDDLPQDLRDTMKTLTRAGILNRLLENEKTNFLLPVSEMFNMRAFEFSDELSSVATGFRKPDDPKSEGVAAELLKLRIAPEGKVTRAGDLLRQAVATTRGRVAGAVIISDGAVNVGEDFDSTARFLKERRVPVYAIGVGDPRPLRDVALANVNVNRIVLLNDIVTLDFDLESQGFADERVTVKLFRGDDPVDVVQEGRIVPAAEFRLEERKAVKDGVEVPLPQKCRIGFRASEQGDFTYRLVVEPRPQELVTENNVATVPVRVVENKIKVLYVEGTPRWEYRYLKNALVRDETIEVSCFLSSADFDFPQEGDLPLALLPAKEEDLAPYDVIILGDVPRKVFSDAQLELFHKFVEKLGGGLLLEAGPYFAPREYRGTVIEKMLPVDLAGPPVSSTGSTAEWKPLLTNEGETHAMTRFDADSQANKTVWEHLPGFFWYYPVDRAKPGALVLLEHPTDRSQYGPRPLLATQFYGSGKTAFMAVDSTWLWRGRVGDRWFMRFWGQVIRDLSQGKFIGTSKRFRVATDRSEYRTGEKVTITARVLDKDYEPSRMSEVGVRLTDETMGVTVVKLQSVQGDPGSFRGTVTPAARGTYKLTLDLSEPGLDVSAISHTFIVTPSRLEFVDPHLRRDELRRLAEATGGQYFDINQVAELPAVIERRKAEAVRPSTDELWNAPMFFAVFCTAFFSELIYRKLRKLL